MSERAVTFETVSLTCVKTVLLVFAVCIASGCHGTRLFQVDEVRVAKAGGNPQIVTTKLLTLPIGFESKDLFDRENTYLVEYPKVKRLVLENESFELSVLNAKSSERRRGPVNYFDFDVGIRNKTDQPILIDTNSYSFNPVKHGWFARQSRPPYRLNQVNFRVENNTGTILTSGNWGPPRANRAGKGPQSGTDFDGSPYVAYDSGMTTLICPAMTRCIMSTHAFGELADAGTLRISISVGSAGQPDIFEFEVRAIE